MSPPIPVSVFSSPPSVSFVRNPKLQAALDAAVAAVATRRKLPAGGYPSPISIVDIGNGVDTQTTLSFAGFRDGEEHYIASEGKVGILFGMFAILSMARRFATMRKPKDTADLFAQMDADATPQIVASVPGLTLPPAELKPRYADLFNVVTTGGVTRVNFTTKIEHALDGMIIKGRNEDTAICVLALRYSYLNGTFVKAGFFNPSSNTGLWVATTFAGKLPRVMIKTVNAASSEASASTSDAMARLMALIVLGGVLGPTERGEMIRRLTKAVHANGGDDQSWITRTDIPGFIPDKALTHDKVGVGTITAGKLAGTAVISEILALDASKIGISANKHYVVAYQNVKGDTPSTADVVAILRTTITEYEKGPVSP